MTVTADDVAAAADSLGLSGRPLEVHASLSSFGHVDGGADGVVDGLLAAGCTLVTPAFSTGMHLLPLTAVPAELRPQRNADEYVASRATAEAVDKVFDVSSREMNRSDGAIAMTVVARAGRRRGNHPLNSFAALGTLAEVIIQGQSRADVYAPLRRLLGCAFLEALSRASRGLSVPQHACRRSTAREIVLNVIIPEPGRRGVWGGGRGYSTVTDLARLRGLSTSWPSASEA